MEVAELSKQVVAVLVSYLSIGAVEFAKTAGDIALAQGRKLLGVLKDRWTKDTEVSGELQHFEEKPQRYQGVIEDILNEKLTADPELAKMLSDILESMGPSLKIVQNIKEAKLVLGVETETFESGDVDVEQTVDKADEVTGGKFKKIG
jgi:hypothetical protein